MKLSVRFKMTLWYSVILITTSIVYTLLTNIVITQQLHKDPHRQSLEIESTKSELLERHVETGSDDDFVTFRDVLNEVHQRDLDRIRLASWLIFVTLVVLSFIGGYFIAGRTLQPLYESLETQKQFIANASHELKTPLSISQINLEAILHDPTMTRAELEGYLRQAVASTSFMNQLIEDLLLLTVTDQQIPFARVDLTQVVGQAVTQLHTLATAANKTLVLECDQSDPIFIQGNATLLQRAVMNGIENAIKYARQTIVVRLVNKDKQSIITIQDDGIGIPAEALPLVTERFFRVDPSRSRASGGSGLGLAITKLIIEHHHGQLLIASIEGKQTTVTITL